MGRELGYLYSKCRGSLCLFQHKTAEGVPKELDFFSNLLLSQDHSYSPQTHPKMSGLGFALSLTLLVGIFWTTACECPQLWLLPVGWGRDPWRADSWQMWWALEPLFERRWDARLWEVLWRSLPRHGDYWHILKKIKTKLLKMMTFLLKATVHTFF